MFKILIVDDNVYRISEIENRIKTEYIDCKIVVEHECEISNAVRKLQKIQYDMVIVDMQLPSINCNTSIDVQGGVRLIDLITNTDRINKPIQIVGITSYDESYNSAENVLRDRLCLLLKYEMGTVGWLNAIIAKIRYMISAKEELLFAFFRDNECDCLIITAVEREMNAVKSCGLVWEKVQTYDTLNSFYTATTESGKKIVAVQQSQMGMVGAAATCSAAIAFFKPKLVAMVGIAAGNEGRVNLGDVIVADTSWDYGSGKLEKKQDHYTLSPDPHYISINPRVRAVFSSFDDNLLNCIKDEWNNGNEKQQNAIPQIHIGALPSGAAVIQTEDLVAEYIEPHNRKMLGLDMETYAIYYVAESAPCEPLFVSVKAVSDYANSQKNDDYQDFAAYLSTRILLHSLDELLGV